MARIMFVIDGPSMATISKPRISDGNASSMSISLHDDDVEAPAVPAGENADHRAQKHGGERRDEADDQRDARAIQKAGEDVAAEGIGADWVLCGRRPELVEDILLDRIVRRPARARQIAARATIRKMTRPTHEVLLALKALTVALAM